MAGSRKRAHDSPQRSPRKRRTVVKHVQFDNGAMMSQFRVTGAHFWPFLAELAMLIFSQIQQLPSPPLLL